MRILAIRGRNLASLAGAFEVRLDAPPLDSAGLFAITGRTGAGKSTILDALCLALYDRMPRLLDGSGAEVGRGDEDPVLRLRNTDVRSILRRGAGEGAAEAEFRGMDGRRYRTRWSVRRARGRADGRFQAQDMSLWDLDSGEDLSGTKTEVLARIESRLGLTFDQFRRSVLLAQGDFAAFLRANAKDRADLLERITGTEIYGRLSRAAHERAKVESEQLRLAEQRLGEHRPLDAEARQALDARLAEAQGRLDRSRVHQTRLQQARVWYQTRDRLAAEHAQAETRLALAEHDYAEAEPRREELERIRVLQPLRLPLARMDQARHAESETRQGLAAARSQAEELQVEVERAQAAVDVAGPGLSTAEQAREAAAPGLAEARRLDTLIQRVADQLEGARQQQATAETAMQVADQSLAGLEHQGASYDLALVEAETWLAGRTAIEPVAAQWAAWERELGRYVQAGEARDQARADQTRAMSSAAELGTARELDAAQVLALDTQRETAATRAKALVEQAAALDLGRLAAEREELSARRQELDGRLRLVHQTSESQARLAGRQSALAEAQSRQQALEVRIQSLDADLQPLRGVLVEAEAANERMLLASAESVETLREHLIDGQPCPVCGSDAHPWANRDAAALQGLARDQQRRVDELRARIDSLTREQSAAAAEAEQASRRQSELGTEIDAEQGMLAALTNDWAACPSDDLRPETPLEPGLTEHIGSEIGAVVERLDRIRRDEEQGRTLAKVIEQARAQIEGLRIQAEEAAGRLQVLDEQIATTRQALGRAVEAETRSAQTLAEVTGVLAVPFAGIGDWEDRLGADPRGFTDGYRALVAEWRQREAQREQQRKDRQALAPRLAEAAARRESAAAELLRCTGSVAEQEHVLAGLTGQRALCLEGRPADLVEHALDSALNQARQALETARQALELARNRLTAIEGRIDTQVRTLASQEAASIEAGTELDAAMLQHEVTLDALRKALERDQTWVETERVALDALDAVRRQARGLVDERARRLAEHDASGSSEWPPEALDEALSAAAAELDAAQGSWGSLHGQREQDDQRLETTAALQAEVERQREQWTTWESLRGLIGSADGSKLRTFAQGLTLESLLAHANVHLTDLARRYALQRVPGAEMELQVVDRDMGDEVRGIHSLSGGEGFLVSLALALGLASLASDRVRVESLFIDEGFGALDADSLDMAIASLDALYGLGRQVGVISHVGTLVERIGARVEIEKQGGGRSRLRVVSG